MATKGLIPITEFCTIHRVEISFIDSLREHGLIEVVSVEQTTYIQEEQIGALEKMLRMHYDLEINAAGIDAILHLLQRMENMNEEMMALKNRLRLYESE